MVPMWMFPVALACGGYLRPEAARTGAVRIVTYGANFCRKAGLPDGVFNVHCGNEGG